MTAASEVEGRVSDGDRPPLTLGDLAVGDSGRVVAIGRGDRSYRERLLAMGLTPGTLFTVLRVAPLGDPVEIRVRGAALSLRKGEARMLTVSRE
jgi:ferrous iron transport protein A